MFSFIIQVFIVLLSFKESLARERTNCLSLNDELWIIRPTLIDLNLVELKYYPFMISLDKFSRSRNVLTQKICVPKQTKSINVFNMITNKNEAKAITKHISCDCKCKFNSATCKSNQKWNNKTCKY